MEAKDIAKLFLADWLVERFDIVRGDVNSREERMDITRGKVPTRLARWYNKVEALGIKYFNTVIQTMQHNYDAIVNYFEHRSTNASAESFNAKIKAFRSQLRGIRDIPLFMFRLKKLFA